jgi:hypothetical protein
MTDYVIHCRINLAAHHKPTGKTRHTQGTVGSEGFVRGAELPSPRELVVAQLPPDKGYYLLYLDGEGEEITDTYHTSLGDALAQAKWEFNVNAEEWEQASPTGSDID